MIYFNCLYFYDYSYPHSYRSFTVHNSIMIMPLAFAFRVRAFGSTPFEKDSTSAATVKQDSTAVILNREDAAPVYATPRTRPSDAYALVSGKGGTQISNYILFEDSIAKCKVKWTAYDALTSEERTIYMAHMRAVEERQLQYTDPKTKNVVFTVSHHLHRGECCGNGCRHCPFELKSATDDVKKQRVWNGAFYV